MIALILGGAQCVWADLEAAEALLGGSRRLVVATNSAGYLYEGRIDAYATLHPENLSGWRAKRAGNDDFRAFSPGQGPLCEIVPEKWPASSGGYGLQIALFELGATAAILCGVPLSREGGHLVQPGPWASPTSYRRAFESMLPEIGGRVRSMSGFTRELFGPPTPDWLASTAFLKPLRPASAPHRFTLMHHVKNVSSETQRFNVRTNQGLQRVTLKPGQAGSFECDPMQAVFQRGHLTAEEVKPAKAPATPRPVAGPQGADVLHRPVAGPPRILKATAANSETGPEAVVPLANVAGQLAVKASADNDPETPPTPDAA